MNLFIFFQITEDKKLKRLSQFKDDLSFKGIIQSINVAFERIPKKIAGQTATVRTGECNYSQITLITCIK